MSEATETVASTGDDRILFETDSHRARFFHLRVERAERQRLRIVVTAGQAKYGLLLTEAETINFRTAMSKEAADNLTPT